MKIKDMKELMVYDKQLRAKAEEVYQKKHDLRKKIEKDKIEISENYWNSAKQEVKIRKEEIDQEIEKNSLFNQSDLEKRKKLLQEKYDENKEEWIEKIVTQSCQ